MPQDRQRRLLMTGRPRCGPSGPGGRFETRSALQVSKSMIIGGLTCFISPKRDDGRSDSSGPATGPAQPRNRAEGSFEVHAGPSTRFVPTCPDSMAVFSFSDGWPGRCGTTRDTWNRLNGIQEVDGSIPFSSTIQTPVPTRSTADPSLASNLRPVASASAWPHL